MNTRSTLTVLAFVALSAPLAAHADAPSGEFYEWFAERATSEPAASNDRAEHRSYVEFSIWDLAASSSEKTREEVRDELVANPQPAVGA